MNILLFYGRIHFLLFLLSFHFAISIRLDLMSKRYLDCTLVVIQESNFSNVQIVWTTVESVWLCNNLPITGYPDRCAIKFPYYVDLVRRPSGRGRTDASDDQQNLKTLNASRNLTEQSRDCTSQFSAFWLQRSSDPRETSEWYGHSNSQLQTRWGRVQKGRLPRPRLCRTLILWWPLRSRPISKWVQIQDFPL